MLDSTFLLLAIWHLQRGKLLNTEQTNDFLSGWFPTRTGSRVYVCSDQGRLDSTAASHLPTVWQLFHVSSGITGTHLCFLGWMNKKMLRLWRQGEHCPKRSIAVDNNRLSFVVGFISFLFPFFFPFLSFHLSLLNNELRQSVRMVRGRFVQQLSWLTSTWRRSGAGFSLLIAKETKSQVVVWRGA